MNFIFFYYNNDGDRVKVKVIDEECEQDLEDSVNLFLEEGHEIIDIKYQISSFDLGEEQIYCFSAMIIYKE